MGYQAALLAANGRCVTGCCHGEAYGKLNEQDKQNCTSGFLDPVTGNFISDNRTIYLKHLLLIRHAAYQTPFLSEDGLKQARRTAEILSQLNLCEYTGFASPYRRCQQTAAIIAAFTGIRFCTENRLGEQEQDENFPEFSKRMISVMESLPAKSILVTHCDVISHITQVTTGQIDNNWRIPTGSLTYIDQQKVVWFGKNVNEE